ncbi:embryonic stem cell-specific 5-hydroxymethylcytosine-binding protein [Chaetomidium leptoderma]|uniref:Embryonic stem cell-specific 5-hydroxymethylcytosine-binding protein n=1 Tax=Chaetomidium leptoderma TaxID=669021 RepID=A0AAN6VCR6_9PEZI|nr:embryonic stem cell-specific 5-hydroxymethylcytosine-binding protein [Chaetomidium leptoderma]
MCGRFAMALRPSQVRQMLQDDDMPVNDAPADDGDGAPRQSYNFAPGYHGVVYRADVPDRGAGAGTSTAHTRGDASADQGTATTTPNQDQHQEEEETQTQNDDNNNPQTHYKLQSMKWGLVPFWTKRNPDYPSLLKTINCRDDSLASPGGLWASMKARKRCVVVAQGFYEWLKTGPKEKVPHYVKRKDGKLMCFAGLWDCVCYDDEDDADAEGAGDRRGVGVAKKKKNYTFTVITTDSNKQLQFLHDRMPVILDPGSEALWRWLDPGRSEWSKDLQAVLRPFAGELEVYPVSKEVGKVGNNSPSFVIPVASRENKGNIANFFAKGGAAAAAAGKKEGGGVVKGEVEVKKEPAGSSQGGGETEMKTVEEVEKTADDGGMGTPRKGIKREADSSPIKGEPPAKRGGLFAKSASPVKGRPLARGKISATTNTARSPAKAKAKADGSQKITKFFGNSA